MEEDDNDYDDEPTMLMQTPAQPSHTTQEQETETETWPQQYERMRREHEESMNRMSYFYTLSYGSHHHRLHQQQSMQQPIQLQQEAEAEEDVLEDDVDSETDPDTDMDPSSAPAHVAQQVQQVQQRQQQFMPQPVFALSEFEALSQRLDQNMNAMMAARQSSPAHVRSVSNS